jgi:thiol-disulfide isomerase/thioredoxin
MKRNSYIFAGIGIGIGTLLGGGLIYSTAGTAAARKQAVAPAAPASVPAVVAPAEAPAAATPAAPVDSPPATPAASASDPAPAASAAPALAAPPAAPAAAAREIPWAKSLAVATAEAKRSGKLLMIDFYTDWCGACKMLDQQTYTNPQVIQFTQQFVSVKVNAEKEGQKAAARYGVTGYPTILFTTAAGDPVGRIPGFAPPAAFLQEVSRILQTHQELPVLEAKLRSDPKDADAATRAALIYLSREDATRAAALLAKAEAANPTNKDEQLTRPYLALGAALVQKNQTGKAITVFRKVLDRTKDPSFIAMAHLGTADCYMMQDQAKQMKAELQIVADMADAPAREKQHAVETLQKIEELEKQGKLK